MSEQSRADPAMILVVGTGIGLAVAVVGLPDVGLVAGTLLAAASGAAVSAGGWLAVERSRS